MPAIPPHKTATTDGPWDEGENETRIPADATADTLRSFFAWVDPDKDATTKAAYKFGHHEVDADGNVGAANLNACSSGIGILNGGRGGADIPDADRQGVWDHIAGHLRDAGREPPALTGRAPQLEAPSDDGVASSEIGIGTVSVMAAIADEYLPMVIAEARGMSMRSNAQPIEAIASSPGASSVGNIAVLPLRGVITPRGSFLARLFGLSSGGLQGFREAFRAALADDNVSAIVIDIDSPGGLTSLVPETAAEIRESRGHKPIVAVANVMAGSAAYWIAAQADEIVVTPSGQVGSVGVVIAHEDISRMAEMMGVKITLISAGRFKVDGSPYEPLSASAEKAMQAKVDDVYGMFVADVAAGRGIAAQAVKAGYGQGSMVLADQALLLGMVDRVESLEQTLVRLGSPTGSTSAEDPGSDDDDLDVDLDDDDEDDEGDDVDARTVPSNHLYGEDLREQPSWLL